MHSYLIYSILQLYNYFIYKRFQNKDALLFSSSGIEVDALEYLLIKSCNVNSES